MAKSTKSGGGGKQTSDRMSQMASKVLSSGKATPTQARSLAASVLSQDQTKGPRKK